MKKQIKNALPTAQNQSLVAARGVSDDVSLAQYIQMVQKIPVLTAQQEYQYASQWVNDRDQVAAEKLVASHLRMVVSVYLLYLVWELREAPASHTGVESLLFIAAMVLFTAVAVILGGLSLRAFLRGEYGHPEDGDDSKS